ncbi:hypothetical protein Pmani_009234 [Petrolisthes manimaculis]|uniref:Reverse transcriptase domain-containing protein n=1 Tax=Petrolisthes manimaculis TaxID=1843537 RepID=A0AAE1Q5B3_9EUCA|nr:hypothetical protein Pmani_009234 [Petrolisthes manimaculis]
MMLKQTTEDIDDEDAIYIHYRHDGSLFNLRRLQAHTKTLEQMIHNLLFADDDALIAHTEGAIQGLTSCFAEAAQLVGLEVSLMKKEFLHQLAPQEEYRLPHITISETKLISVHQFTYLGCTISSNANIDKEIDNSLAKANSAFGRLYKKGLKQQTIKERYKDQSLQCHCAHHTTLWFRVVVHLSAPPVTSRAIPSALSPHHPQNPLA